MKCKVLLCVFALAAVLVFTACGGNGSYIPATGPVNPSTDDPLVIDEVTPPTDPATPPADDLPVIDEATPPTYTRHTVGVISLPVYDSWEFSYTDEGNASITIGDNSVLINVIPIDSDVMAIKEVVLRASVDGFNPQSLIVAELESDDFIYPTFSATYTTQVGGSWANAMSFLVHGDEAFFIAHVFIFDFQFDEFNEIFDFVAAIRFI